MIKNKKIKILLIVVIAILSVLGITLGCTNQTTKNNEIWIMHIFIEIVVWIRYFFIKKLWAALAADVAKYGEVYKVKIYIEPPENYELLGIVEAWRSQGWGSRQNMQDKILEVLREKSAKIGGNGVLITDSSIQTSWRNNFIIFLSAKDVRITKGYAIYVLDDESMKE